MDWPKDGNPGATMVWLAIKVKAKYKPTYYKLVGGKGYADYITTTNHTGNTS